MLSLLLSKGGLTMIAVALVVAAIGVQTARLGNAKHDLANTRAALTAEKAASAGLRASVATSEQRRAAEYATATTALSGAEKTCSARVAQAHRAADHIRALVEKPYVADKSGCPVRSVIGAGELRDAIRPGA